jgi:hypothetical protein
MPVHKGDSRNSRAVERAQPAGLLRQIIRCARARGRPRREVVEGLSIDRDDCTVKANATALDEDRVVPIQQLMAVPANGALNVGTFSLGQRRYLEWHLERVFLQSRLSQPKRS